MALDDVGAEKAVLAGIFRYGHDCFIDVDDIISPNSFHQECNQIIFKCVKNHFSNNKSNLDVPTIYSSAKELGLFHIIDNADDKKHLRALQNFPILRENVRKFAVRLKKLEVANALVGTLKDCQQSILKSNGNGTLNEIIALAEGPVCDFTNSISCDSGPKLLGEDVEEYIEHLKSNPCNVIGLSSGFPLYDLSIGGGFRRGTVNVAAARTKVGKSTFAINIALHVSGKLNIPVLYLDTELTKRDHLNKSHAYLSGVTVNQIETGKFGTNNFQSNKIAEASKKIKTIPYYYENVSNMSFEEILSTARRWLVKHVGYENGSIKDCLIIYDQINLNNADDLGDGMREYQALGFQVKALHNFVVKYDVPCFSLIQLSRDGIDKETTGVIAQSDRVAWFCSNLAILKPKTKEEIAEEGFEKGNRKLIPLICRHGEGLQEGDYINIGFNGSIAKLYEIGTRNGPWTKDFKEEIQQDDVAY